MMEWLTKRPTAVAENVYDEVINNYWMRFL